MYEQGAASSSCVDGGSVHAVFALMLLTADVSFLAFFAQAGDGRRMALWRWHRSGQSTRSPDIEAQGIAPDGP